MTVAAGAIPGDRRAAWLDREWSTSALGAGVVGWDWFALQLADGRDLMFYRLRREDGAADPWSARQPRRPPTAVRTLSRPRSRLTPLATWRSPRGGDYPVRWRLELPAEELDLELTPRVDDQELAVTVRYWEGAVAVGGTSRGNPVDGHGFVEMTGYDPPTHP